MRPMSFGQWFVVVLLIILLAFGVFVLLTRVAKAATTDQVLYDILSERDSPLADEAYTVVAFRRAQGPEFDMLAFYSVAWAETNLARDGFYAQTYNPTCIRGGSVGTLWRDLRTGTWGSGFNTYATPRDGQRAALRLIWERGYAPLLKAHDWRGFTKKYWGSDYYSNPEHREEYIKDLTEAHRYLVDDGREHGLAEVHLQ